MNTALPRLHRVASTGATTRLSSDARLPLSAAPEILDRLLAPLSALAAATTGIVLVPDDTAPRVALELCPPSELAGIPTAVGAHPDPDGAPDERYLLTIHDGAARVRASGPAGLFRGVTALLQLCTLDDGITAPAVDAADGPALTWRGLSLDVARHFLRVEEIERVIDLLAWHRLSVLHLHLTDSQAWRLESRRYPLLTAGTEEFYSADDLEHLIAYASARYVSLVPEIDMPGHTASALRAYPDLAAGAHFVHPFLVFLDPGVAAAVEFAETVLDEVAALAPSRYLHIGGDEAFGMPDDAFAAFVTHVVEHVHGLGREVIGWQETTRSAALGTQDIAQFWISPKDSFDADKVKRRVSEDMHDLVDLAAATFAHAPQDAERARAAGVPVIVSSSSPLYLDRPYAEAGDPAQDERRQRVGFADYDPEPTSDLDDWDPLDSARTGLPGLQVVGAEAAIWSETIDGFDDLAFLLLPRLAIAADRMWGATGGGDWAGTAGRLRAAAPAWERLGLGEWFRSTLVTAPGAASSED